jgi:hypothetical protein
VSVLLSFRVRSEVRVIAPLTSLAKLCPQRCRALVVRGADDQRFWLQLKPFWLQLKPEM